jgi:hypothetical protein
LRRKSCRDCGIDHRRTAGASVLASLHVFSIIILPHIFISAGAFGFQNQPPLPRRLAPKHSADVATVKTHHKPGFAVAGVVVGFGT